MRESPQLKLIKELCSETRTVTRTDTKHPISVKSQRNLPDPRDVDGHLLDEPEKSDGPYRNGYVE